MGTSNRAAENASSDRYAGLDAVRVIAVVVVVLFHAGALIPGGLLGVSVFFVLSGFLVGGRLWANSGDGGIDRSRFWNRRIRRLMPASLLVLAAIVSIWARGQALGATDVWSSVFPLRNWALLVTHAGYGAAPSPTEHYWSLAVEEQVYLVLPVLLVAVVSVARRSAAAIVAVIAVASMVGCAWTASNSLDVSYLATPWRVGR
ncbi:MAG: acyltransferase family protein [Ilumatobacteraceae bacterium]